MFLLHSRESNPEPAVPEKINLLQFYKSCNRIKALRFLTHSNLTCQTDSAELKFSIDMDCQTKWKEILFWGPLSVGKKAFPPRIQVFSMRGINNTVGLLRIKLSAELTEKSRLIDSTFSVSDFLTTYEEDIGQLSFSQINHFPAHWSHEGWKIRNIRFSERFNYFMDVSFEGEKLIQVDSGLDPSSLRFQFGNMFAICWTHYLQGSSAAGLSNSVEHCKAHNWSLGSFQWLKLTLDCVIQSYVRNFGRRDYLSFLSLIGHTW